MSRTRVNYKKIYEEFHGVSIPRGMHIHHVDGDSHNNEISNLMMVTPEEHVEMHERLGHKKIGNFIKKANNQIGIPCSESKKLNISKSLKNKKLSEDHKIKISKKLSPIIPFLVFDKNTGNLIGKFMTKGSCGTLLKVPLNKLRKCLSKKRHSIGTYYFIYENEYDPSLNVKDVYANTIKNSLKQMGESQRKRLCQKR